MTNGFPGRMDEDLAISWGFNTLFNTSASSSDMTLSDRIPIERQMYALFSTRTSFSQNGSFVSSARWPKTDALAF